MSREEISRGTLDCGEVVLNHMNVLNEIGRRMS